MIVDDEALGPPVTEMRVAVTTGMFERVQRFYREGLGLEPSQEWPEDQGRALVLDLGRATLELFDEQQAATIDRIEVGSRSSGPVRLALQVPDLDAAIRRLKGCGATPVRPPVTTPWGDRNVRFEAPDGMHVTLYEVPAGTTPATGFDRQPVLESALVRLRPLRPDDHDDLYAVAADARIWEQHPAKRRSEPDGFRAFFDESLASGGALVVIDVETGAVIGSSRFHGHDEERSEVEIGWTFLARSHWGGAYNGEVKRLMLEHAFRFVRSVVFIVDVDNVRSQRAVEKIGAVRDPTPLEDGRLLFRLDGPEPDVAS